ncbi:zinc finger protein 37-like isoform X1 [Phyllopteryx taeniolatus]|uniref:zinc finger protein 37-like isoform X1 n=1 Tax=Phyllopteryx taeniolatus TaxID=161469 RepID=UPI002AD223EE|nr:zinc finger protein 37-like isoform X1 [Phyllopteryx taeniolatus]
MLKDLVRERLIAAADEIFGLFETTIASYEEQLCRAKAENELQRQQLEAVCKTQVVLHVQDIQQRRSSSLKQEHLQSPHIKEEKVEADISKLPLTAPHVESVDGNDEPPESLQFHHHSPSRNRCGGPPPDDLLAPLSDCDDMEELLGSDVEREDIQQHNSSSLKQEHLQSPHIKEEKEEADISKLPLTAPHVESVDGNDEPPESLQFHHQSPSQNRCGGPPPDDLLAPLSDCEDMEELLRTDVEREGDDKQSNHSEKMTTFDKEETSQMCEQHFTCSICGKHLANNSILMRHLRTHTGEKPFGCIVCGKRFTQKPSMVSHMRTHTGEKPFVCLVCGKAFTQKPHLVSHMRTHTGEKPFSCSICSGRFRHRSNLNAHMRRHQTERINVLQ